MDEEAAPAADKGSPKPGLLTDLDFGPLKSRGLTEETCRKFAYGTTKDQKGTAVQVAQYFRGGRVVAQKLRTRDKKFSVLGEGKTMPLFGQHLWGTTGRAVVVTEGEIDAMTVSQLQDHRWPVVSLPNGAQGGSKSLQANLEWLEGYERVVLMFDMDEPGQAAALECAALFSPGKACIANLPLKDPNECLLAGKGEEVRRAFWNAPAWRPDAILEGSSLLEAVMAYKEPEGVPWPWEGLNGRKALLKLSVPGVHTLIAGTGAGKSTICRALEYHLIQAGENVGCLHFEEPPEDTALGIVGYHLGKRLTLGQGESPVDPEELRKAFAATAGREGVYFYDAFGSTDIDGVVAKIRYLSKAGRCRFVIVDHISILVSGAAVMDERKTIDVAMTKFRTLAEECGIGIILVSHLSRGDGKDPEKGGEISRKMIRGSQAIIQLSDTCSALERNQEAEGEERNVTLWRGLKCRKTGRTGPFLKLLYDEETGRLTEVPLEWGAAEFKPDEFSSPGDFTGTDDIPF